MTLEEIVEISYPQQPHCPTVLLLDISGSMIVGDKIGQLNDGIRAFKEEIEKDELARKRVDLAVVTFGQKVDVIGKCTRGMKNGNFDFYVNGIQVARTKFSRDEEIKTKCFINGVQTYNLYTCMSINANGMNPNVQGSGQAPAVQAPFKKSVWD